MRDHPAAARAPARAVGRALLVFFLVFASGALGFALPQFGGRLALLLLPSGIAVAALLRGGRALWPAVFAAELALDLSHGTAWLPALVIACGLPAGAWLTAWLLERGGFDRRFAQARDVGLFIGAALVGMVLPGVCGAVGLAIEGATAGLPVYALRWWINTFAGVLLVGPLLTALDRDSLGRLRARPLPVAAHALVTLALAAVVVLFTPPAPLAPGVRSPLIVLALVLVVVSSMRFGLVGSAATTFVLTLAGALSFAFDRGILAGLGELTGLVVLWSFIGALAGMELIVTALLAERDAAAAERLRAERRYAEVFEASPQPLWVHEPATGAFLLVNEATERQYGYGRDELLAMRVTDLAAPGGEPPVPAPGDSAPFETRHVARDGRVVEIDMWTRPIDFGGRSAVLVFAADVTERKALGRALIDAIAGEQRRIGEEMHDGLGQELTGLALCLRALAVRARREGLALADDLDQLGALVSGCIRSARHIVHGLSPLADADGNLVAAMTHLADTSSAGGVPVSLDARLEGPLTLPLEARGHLLRIAQEAVQNALKHAAASRIDIELVVRPGTVRLAVRDDGRGPPDPAVPGRGLGMRTMRYRAAAIGGRFVLVARGGGGTEVRCDAPQPAAAAALESA